jgi:hypothetical protein
MHERPVILAQALGEYAAVSAIVSAFSQAWTRAQYFVSSIEPRTWAIAGVCLLFVLYLRNRR